MAFALFLPVLMMCAYTAYGSGSPASKPIFIAGDNTIQRFNGTALSKFGCQAYDNVRSFRIDDTLGTTAAYTSGSNVNYIDVFTGNVKNTTTVTGASLTAVHDFSNGAVVYFSGWDNAMVYRVWAWNTTDGNKTNLACHNCREAGTFYASKDDLTGAWEKRRFRFVNEAGVNWYFYGNASGTWALNIQNGNTSNFANTTKPAMDITFSGSSMIGAVSAYVSTGTGLYSARLQGSTPSNPRVVIEEGVVPNALAQSWGSLSITGMGSLVEGSGIKQLILLFVSGTDRTKIRNQTGILTYNADGEAFETLVTCAEGTCMASGAQVPAELSTLMTPTMVIEKYSQENTLAWVAAGKLVVVSRGKSAWNLTSIAISKWNNDWVSFATIGVEPFCQYQPASMPQAGSQPQMQPTAGSQPAGQPSATGPQAGTGPQTGTGPSSQPITPNQPGVPNQPGSPSQPLPSVQPNGQPIAPNTQPNGPNTQPNSPNGQPNVPMGPAGPTGPGAAPAQEEEEEKDSKKGIIIGASVGGGALLLGAGLVWMLMKKKAAAKAASMAMSKSASSPGNFHNPTQHSEYQDTQDYQDGSQDYYDEEENTGGYDDYGYDQTQTQN